VEGDGNRWHAFHDEWGWSTPGGSLGGAASAGGSIGRSLQRVNRPYSLI